MRKATAARLAGTSLAVLAALFLGAGHAGSDDPGFDLLQNPIIGTWTFDGTLQEPPNDPIPLFGMVTFNPGGTLIENDADTAPSPGFRNTPALGSWTQTGPNTYVFRARTFVFGPDETVVARGTGTGTLKLKGPNKFEGSGTYKIIAEDGTVLVGNGVFTQNGTRFKAQ
ncbi:MAG TPA: hypothetical protein VGL15_07750 [Vicinamibacteria bacterium]|jgi:hypothetical protein